ncbi:hypothetical protein LIER_15989 [Lithospermum erythrorhizon]|uniref:Uncharacterized protein n=1 Tax=Lithospermum erythrorhizon TaxID=34254 RepID=A0AAV3Q9M1_LITER
MEGEGAGFARRERELDLQGEFEGDSEAVCEILREMTQQVKVNVRFPFIFLIEEESETNHQGMEKVSPSKCYPLLHCDNHLDP